MRFHRSRQITTGIPTAALPDIVFLLLLFFMLSSYFRVFQGLPVDLPKAQYIQKAPGVRNVIFIWVDGNDHISVEDEPVTITELEPLITKKITTPGRQIQSISLRVDQRASMGTILAIQRQLRQVGGAALNIHYSTQPIDQDQN